MVDPGSASAASAQEAALLAALRVGDEQAFAALVHELGPAMRRFVLTFVRAPAVADEVVQEAWLGALHGLDGFEGRSSLKTWLFHRSPRFGVGAAGSLTLLDGPGAPAASLGAGSHRSISASAPTGGSSTT